MTARSSLARCLRSAAAALSRPGSSAGFSSPPLSRASFASPEAAGAAAPVYDSGGGSTGCIFAEAAPPPPKAASIPTLLQPRVVIYDGVCHLCHRGVKWVIKADKHEKIKFCCLQSKAAEPYLMLCGVDREDVLRRFLFIEGPDSYYEGSTAALKVASYLPFPYSALSALLIIPRPMRDAIYDYIAKRRYGWFGKEEACIIKKQDKELLDRFIDRDEMMGGDQDDNFF